MRKPVTRAALALGAVAALGAGGAGIATAGAVGPSGAGGSTPSRLDDGKDLVGRAKITEAQAIEAAQTAASGGLNEVDLEYAGGTLVFNVDVGSKDVKVDADSGKVVSANADD